MKSLKKLLLWRFVVIVAAHTILILLAMYVITVINIRRSVEWDLKRFEKRLVNCIEENQDKSYFLNLVSSLNSSEERKVSYTVYDSEKNLVFGEKHSGELKAAQLKSNFLSYKKWEYERVSQVNGNWYVSRIRVDLDFVDDTLWIMGLSLPVILLPALVFANRSFRTVVEPVRAISSTLKNVEKGNLGDRVAGGAGNEEIDTLIKRMNEALGTLEESFKHSERFNANAAHELKTPLASLRGEIDVCLQKERTFEEYEDCLVKCQDEIRHLDEILKILLLISNPGNTMKDSFQSFNLLEAFKENEELLFMLAAEKDIKLETDLEAVEVSGSKELIKRAFFNLIENAVKFSPHGSRVKVTLNDRLFSVEDYAAVIPESQKEEILKPFHRLKSQESGAGLGLSLVKWIVDLHGYNLEITPGLTGNKFSIIMGSFNLGE